MIIDGVSEELAALVDRDTDSPVQTCSHYSCSSPTEPNLVHPCSHYSCSSPSEPNPVQTCSHYSCSSPTEPNPVHPCSHYSCSSPTEPNLGSPMCDPPPSWSPQNCLNVSVSQYQGVRVKNTVKELIMQKRHQEIQAEQYQVENEFPALSCELQGRKRSAENLFYSPVKRLSLLSPYSQRENFFNESEILEDIGDVLSKEQLSIESVTVKGCSTSAVCHPLQKLYIDVEIPIYPGYHLLQSTETIYPSSVQSQSSQTPPRLNMTPAPPVSFFEWQIQQEEEKLATLSNMELISVDADGDTFLHVAVAQGRRALAFVLARKMAAINMLDVKEHNKQSAFQVSVAANQHLIAQDLLSLGAEVDTLDCWGRSPLHVCAEKGHTLTLQAIQKAMQTDRRNVNMEVVNYDGLTPLHVAVLSHNGVVQELSCHGTPPSCHTVALVQRRKLLGECINTLLIMGASIKTKDRKSGRTALHMAAEEANVELLHLFLDQPNHFTVINAKAFNGNTALHVVSALQGRQAQVDAVRLLLRRGADPSAKNLENEHPSQLVPEGPLGDQVRRTLKGKAAQSRQ